MFKLFLIIFFSLQIFASTSIGLNPKSYALLGNVIYNNTQDLEKLSQLSSFQDKKLKINDYILRCNKCKSEGFLIDNGDKKYNSNEYYNKLRTLSIENDLYIKLANDKFFEAIESENTKLFIDLVDLSIVDKENISDKLKDFIALHVRELKETLYYKDHYSDSSAAQISQNNDEFAEIQNLREEDKNSSDSLKAKLESILASRKNSN